MNAPSVRKPLEPACSSEAGAGLPPASALLGWLALYAGLICKWAWLGSSRQRAQMFLLGAALYNLRGLQARGAELLQACRRDHRPLCMVVLDCADLLEARSIYGKDIGRKLLARIVRKLNQIVNGRARGLAARTGPAQFTLLLPGLGREQALQAVWRVLGNPCCVELEAGEGEVMLVPDLALRVAGPNIASVNQLHTLLCHELATRRENQSRHLRHIARERERHSRPMGLGTSSRPLARRPVAAGQALAGPALVPSLE